MNITAIIGTGGIGAGLMYRLTDNRPLGRNESRPAFKVDQRDYCKQHIILHYVSVLARDLKRRLRVLPIGAVGEDELGERLCGEMKGAGMDLTHVRRIRGTPTLYAVCYLFPDGAGGNLTEAESASAKVSPAAVRRAAAELRTKGKQSMVVAAPEVPLTSRIELLRQGRRHGAYNIASFVPEEMKEMKRAKILPLVDLLALNIDEAALLGGRRSDSNAESIVAACARRVEKENPDARLIVTNGVHGAYGCENGTTTFLPALKMSVKNTAGAGDAFLSGVMLGLILDLPFTSRGTASCLHLGRAVAALKVTSPHTIHFGIDLKSLRTFLRKRKQAGLLSKLR